eukprot:g6431.t1
MAGSLAEALGVEADGAEERFKIGGGGYGGGGGASVGTIDDKVTGDKYFYKKAGPSGASMLEAERAGLQAMHDAGAIRVPRPICGGDGPGGCFAIFEHLNMGGRASPERAELMGVQLAQMHRSLSPNGKYGFHVDNTIGATPQPNGWMDSWVDFWVERRLKHMIRLSEQNGGVFQNVDKVVEKTRLILSKHEVQPCLVHGDLWGGNQGFVAPENDPVIFDPATYYGDREVDLGMTHVFGGFPAAFYRGYEKEWPLPTGHQERQAFHARCFPEGHRQTNLDLWAGLEADAVAYEVKYAEGYEPYGFFFRQHAPPFDERFRGFGLDKVSHCWHLHRLGWAFKALPAAFVVDVPHPLTKHRSMHQTNPAFRASVDGLFQRFMIEVDRPILTAGSSLKSSAATGTRHSLGDEAASFHSRGNRRVVHDAQPRDYEVLAQLSLLVWGDAWLAAGTHQQVHTCPLTKHCGGGWNLKGSADSWSGLRFESPSSHDEDDLAVARQGKMERGSEAERVAAPGGLGRVVAPPRMVGGWADVCLGGGEGSGGFGLRGRSVIQPRTVHGVMRYWIHPRWDPKKSLRGKLPGLGMSGDVRFLVRWHSGSVGYCCLMTLGRPLQDICEVHVVREAPFSLEPDKTTSIQLEADMRRTPDNGGALSFRAWADGTVVYEARVYAGDVVVSGGQRSGMHVEDVFLHALARAGGDSGEEKGLLAAAQHVYIGGIEVWGRGSAEKLGKRLEAPPSLVDAGREGEVEKGVSSQGNVAPMASMAEKLRFVFVASTGRCGTHYLSQLLATAPGVVAFHEAAPKLSGHDTLLAAATAPEKSYAKRRHKAEDMLRSARRLCLVKSGLSMHAQGGVTPGSLTYVETSHLFLKTYSDVVMRELAPFFAVDVIVLRRDPAASLRSRIELGHLCERNKQSDWLLLPPRDELRAFIATAAGSRGCREADPSEDVREVDMDGFEALMAYEAYIEASIRKFRGCYEKKERAATSDPDNWTTAERRKGVSLPRPRPSAEPRQSSTSSPPVTPGVSCNVVETSLEALQTEQGVRKLFAELSLVVSEERTWRVVEAGATNTRDGEKRRTVPLEYCRQRIISASPSTVHPSREV